MVHEFSINYLFIYLFIFLTGEEFCVKLFFS